MFICLRPLPYVTHCIQTGKGGGGVGGSTSEKVRGSLIQKRGRKYQHDRLYLQSINSIKHQLRQHLWSGVFIVIWSMQRSIGSYLSSLFKRGGLFTFIETFFDFGVHRVSCISSADSPPLPQFLWLPEKTIWFAKASVYLPLCRGFFGMDVGREGERGFRDGERKYGIENQPLCQHISPV